MISASTKVLAPPKKAMSQFTVGLKPVLALVLTCRNCSVIRIGGNTGQMADMGESVMRIGGNTGQMADSGKSVIRIGGNTGQMADSGSQSRGLVETLVKWLIWVSRS